MLCPRCGTSVGSDSPTLCPGCRAQSKIEGGRSEASVGIRAPQAVNPTLHDSALANRVHLFSANKFMFIAFIGLAIFLAAFAALTLKETDPKFTRSALCALTLAFATLSAIGWGLMWMELLLSDFLIAMLSLLLVFPAYWVLVTYPERAMRPFVLHAVFGASAFFLANLFTDLYKMTPVTFLQRVFL